MACSHPIINYTPGRYIGCSNTPKAIGDWLVNHGGGVLYFNGCFGYKKIRGTNTVSVHATGRAIDISVKSPRVDGPNNRVMKFLLDGYIMPNACSLGIQRMIFEGRVWESNMSTTLKHAQWRKLKSGDPHNDHLHLEVTTSKQNKFRLVDVNAMMLETKQLNNPAYTPPTSTDPVNSTPVPKDPSVFESAGGDTSGSGGGTGAPVTLTIPVITETKPVWSALIPVLGPCAACGEFFQDLTEEQVLQVTHCSGTGAICINRTSGATCSTGTAPELGNFPGPIQDFLFWGNGAYGLSTDGFSIYNLGEAVTPNFKGDRGPWTNLYAISPNTIAVSALTSTGFRSAKATVNSIASHTCCG